MSDAIEIAVGFVPLQRYGTQKSRHEAIVERLQGPLTVINTRPVDPKHLLGLAGPNDAFQLIADAETWVNVARLLVVIGGGAFLKVFGKGLATRALDRLAGAAKDESDAKKAALQEWIDGLPETVKSAQVIRHTITLAIPLQGNTRNAGLQLTGTTPDEVYRQIFLFGIQTPEIDQAIALLQAQGKALSVNPDLSICVELGEDGVFSISLRQP